MNTINAKRLLLAFAGVFVFIFFFEWVFHGVLLKPIYEETMSLWRPQDEFTKHFGWLVLGQAVIAFMFVFLFARGFAGGGVGAGIGLGIIIALIRLGLNLITYAVQPIGGKLVAAWTIGGLVEAAIAGAIVGAIYKSAAAQPPAAQS